MNRWKLTPKISPSVARTGLKSSTVLCVVTSSRVLPHLSSRTGWNSTGAALSFLEDAKCVLVVRLLSGSASGSLMKLTNVSISILVHSAISTSETHEFCGEPMSRRSRWMSVASSFRDRATWLMRRGTRFRLGIGALAVAQVTQFRNAVGGELVKPTDPLVKALGYVPEIDKLKGKDAPKDHKKGTKCANCQFYGDATGKAPQAKCQLIAGGEVLASGWCKSYSQRPGSKLGGKA